MSKRNLDPNKLLFNEDWLGNNAAFCCPVCGKVFIVSSMINKNGRKCPVCGKSTGFCKGGQLSGGIAYIEWEDK